MKQQRNLHGWLMYKNKGKNVLNMQAIAKKKTFYSCPFSLSFFSFSIDEDVKNVAVINDPCYSDYK